jgi:hypothetical protein
MMAGVAQLEEFDEALYKIAGDGEDNEKYYYISFTISLPLSLSLSLS